MKFKLLGAVSIEAAFIIPIVITLLLAIIEVVNYAADRLIATSILADELQLARSHAIAVQNGSDPQPNPAYAECSQNNVVVLNSNFSIKLGEKLKKQFGDDGEIKDVKIQVSDPQPGTFQTYVVSVSIPARPIILPDIIQLPINVTNLVTWDLSC